MPQSTVEPVESVPDPPSDFSVLLATMRKERKWRRAEVARKMLALGVSTTASALYQYETDRIRPTREKALALAQVFDDQRLAFAAGFDPGDESRRAYIVSLETELRSLRRQIKRLEAQR